MTSFFKTLWHECVESYRAERQGGHAAELSRQKTAAMIAEMKDTREATRIAKLWNKAKTPEELDVVREELKAHVLGKKDVVEEDEKDRIEKALVDEILLNAINPMIDRGVEAARLSAALMTSAIAMVAATDTPLVTAQVLRHVAGRLAPEEPTVPDIPTVSVSGSDLDMEELERLSLRILHAGDREDISVELTKTLADAALTIAKLARDLSHAIQYLKGTMVRAETAEATIAKLQVRVMELEERPFTRR